LHNRLILKQKLLSTIVQVAEQKGINPEYPITDTIIAQEMSNKIEALTENLEALNPFPQPLLYGVSLLDGIWQLHYSTAREIRVLNKLPFGFSLKKVYQVIDTQNASFFNIAFVNHPSNLFKGYVKVTATFTPAVEENEMIAKQKIKVNFDKRYLSISKILGIKTPWFEPIRVFNAGNPQGRTPSLNITYIDDSLRIGRGGEGSLFILSKRDQLIDI
jgi:hypothetical protein